MIYDSIDTIPAKLFFKIQATGKIKELGSTGLESEEKLKEAWGDIVEAQSKLDPDNSGKELNIYKQIEVLSAKYQCVKLCVYYLKKYKDKELISLLQDKYRYQFTDDFQGDISRIDRESEGILIKIERLKTKLPKLPETSNIDDALGIDRAILQYATICEWGFIDTNTITLKQYYSMIEIGNTKIKTLEKVGR